MKGKDHSFEIDFIDGLYLSSIDLQFFRSSWMVSFIPMSNTLFLLVLFLPILQSWFDLKVRVLENMAHGHGNNGNPLH